MRAAVLNEHDITGLSVRDDVRTIPLSDVLVRVRIRAAGVCHSDLSAVTGKLGLPAPFVVGHEAAGEVVDVGDGVDEFAAGDRVMVSWVPQCGTCTDCRGDRPELCSYNTEPSYRRPRFLIGDQPIAAQAGCGVFAEEIVVTKHNLVQLPDDVPFDVGALISCGVSTGVGAVRNTAGLRGGETVVVIGCGGVGLSIVQAARAAGAESVVAVDPVPVKRELAMTLGASAAIEPAGLAESAGSMSRSRRSGRREPSGRPTMPPGAAAPPSSSGLVLPTTPCRSRLANCMRVGARSSGRYSARPTFGATFLAPSNRGGPANWRWSRSSATGSTLLNYRGPWKKCARGQRFARWSSSRDGCDAGC